MTMDTYGCGWKLFIISVMGWIAIGMGMGITSLIGGSNNTANYTTTTYNTTNFGFELNFLSNNSETLGVIGLTIVLIMVMRTLRNG